MNFYLVLDENDVVQSMMAIEYNLNDTSKILWNEFDLTPTTIKKKYNRETGLLEDHMYPKDNVISRLEFRHLFTLEEISTIYGARSTDIIAEIFIDDIQASEFIDMDDVNTLNGIGYLHQAGYITYERLLVIIEG